jgi:hypothetical protein
MSLKQRAHGSELHGYPIPRMPITFDLRQEPGAGKPHARICTGGRGAILVPTVIVPASECADKKRNVRAPLRPRPRTAPTRRDVQPVSNVQVAMGRA